VFKKKDSTRAEEPKKCTYQDSDGTYHVNLLSHFAGGRQYRMLLKSQADRILARGRGNKGKDARLLAQFCRLFSRMDEGDLGMVLFMAQKMARRKAV